MAPSARVSILSRVEIEIEAGPGGWRLIQATITPLDDPEAEGGTAQERATAADLLQEVCTLATGCSAPVSHPRQRLQVIQGPILPGERRQVA
jgi:hypothetical protein